MLSDYTRSGQKVLMLPGKRNCAAPRREIVSLVAIYLQQPQSSAMRWKASAAILYTKMVIPRRDALRLSHNLVALHNDLYEWLIYPVYAVDHDRQLYELRFDRVGEYGSASDQKRPGTNDGLDTPVHPEVERRRITHVGFGSYAERVRVLGRIAPGAQFPGTAVAPKPQTSKRESAPLHAKSPTRTGRVARQLRSSAALRTRRLPTGCPPGV